jgi:hypothetical protein
MSTNSSTLSGMQQRECPHCEGKGFCHVCSQESCKSCVRWMMSTKFERWMALAPSGMPDGAVCCKCSVCGGKGFVEGATFKMRNYFPFFFASAFVICSFLIFGFKADGGDKLQSSLTTILGTIVGFYFGGRKSDA